MTFKGASFAHTLSLFLNFGCLLRLVLKRKSIFAQNNETLEGKFLDNITSTFELELPQDLQTMEQYINYIVPRVKYWSGKIENTKLWQERRWMEIQGTEAWDKSFIHIFMPDGEYLIFDNGVMTKRSWRYLSGALVLDEGRSTILYDIDFINDTFLILKQHGTNRYFVLGDEKFVKKVNYDWYNAMEELYNIYRHNSKFSMWVFVLIFFLVMFLAYFYM